MEQVGEGRHDLSFKFFFSGNTGLSSPFPKEEHSQLSTITDPTAVWLPGDMPGAGVTSRVDLGSSAAS